MTPAEIGTAKLILSEQAFRAALEDVVSRVVVGAACGAAVSLVIAALGVQPCPSAWCDHSKGDVSPHWP